MKMIKKNVSIFLAIALLFTSTGCSEDAEVENDNDENTVENNSDPEKPDPFVIEDPYELVPFQDGVDKSDGHPEIEAGIPDDGEVRLGRIAGDETGFTGLMSHCRTGDFLLSNSKIEVCIQEESTNRYELYSGGILVDARRHDQPQGEDVLDMVFPRIDFGTASADSVEVVRDGSDGGVAVLRVTGQDVELAHVTGVLGQRLGNFFGMTVETEYRLEPESMAVEMVSHFTAPSSQDFQQQVGDWFAYGDRARPWTPGVGFELPDAEMPWVAGVGDGHSFAMVFEDMATPMRMASGYGLPWAEMRTKTVIVSEEDPGVMRRWFVVGDGTLDSIRTLAAEFRDEEIADEPIALTVLNEADEPVAGAEIMVHQADQTITYGHTNEDGSLELLLDSGSYQAEVREFAGPLTVERDFEVDEGGEATIVIPEVAHLSLEIREAGLDQLISSRVTFEDDDLGRWFDYALGGTLETKVPVGEITVMVTRGLEYDLYRETAVYDAGQHYDEQIELVRGLDTEGWRSGDFHQHMEPSVDSRVLASVRVMENVTQGVNLMVPTDHEVVTDVQPEINKLGLGDEISTFPGVEISPFYSHYNLFPVPFQPHLRGRGSIELAYLMDGEIEMRRMPEIIAIAREFETDPVVQMNHPRNNSGMLGHVSYDPELGPDAVTHDDFAIDIDTIEVINRYGHICQVLGDWSGMLNAGYKITGLGNSDTHHDNAEAGVPRNYFPLDVEPGEIEPGPVQELLRAGRVTVASHAFMDFTDGTMPGDEIAADEQGRVTFDVRVQTPDWAATETLFVIVNGSVVEIIERSAESGSRVDFEETIEVEVEEDSWIVFWSDGPRPGQPLPQRKQVIAFTNPVFVTTGNGDWEAPGIQPLDLEAIDTGYCD